MYHEFFSRLSINLDLTVTPVDFQFLSKYSHLKLKPTNQKQSHTFHIKRLVETSDSSYCLLSSNKIPGLITAFMQFESISNKRIIFTS